MGGAQLAADRAQAGFVQLALPVGLEGLLQLAVAADARKAEGVRQCHLSVSMLVNERHCRQPAPHETNSIYSQ
ncbi:hypothetical protein D3C78_1789520 [compost metagenome]